jgi:hypothetical protein
LQTAEEATNRQFNNHIVVFILSLEDSPLIGLHNLIQPLRASSITFEGMHEVVLVGDLEKIRQEWMTINMLPKIWVVGVSKGPAGNLVTFLKITGAAIARIDWLFLTLYPFIDRANFNNETYDTRY